MGPSRSDRLKLLLGEQVHAVHPAPEENRHVWKGVETDSNPEPPAAEPAITGNTDACDDDEFRGEDLESLCASSPDEIVTPSAIFTTDIKGSAHPTTSARQVDRVDEGKLSSVSDFPGLDQQGSTATTATILGELSPPGLAFCPVKAVEKYPYRYVSKAGQDKVASGFFAGGRFWERYWSL